MNDFPDILRELSRSTHALTGTEPWSIASAGQLMVDDNPPSFPSAQGLPEHVCDLIAKAAVPPTGWILWSERLQILQGSGKVSTGEKAGWMLAAELHFPAAGSATDFSITVQRKGRDWLVQTIRRVESPIDAELGLPAAFLEYREFLPWPQLSELSGHKLHYEVAWQLTSTLPTRTYRPALSRFIGLTSNSSPA